MDSRNLQRFFNVLRDFKGLMSQVLILKINGQSRTKDDNMKERCEKLKGIILVWAMLGFLHTTMRKLSILHRELLHSLWFSLNPVAVFPPHRLTLSPVIKEQFSFQ